jgi:titin
LIGGTAPGARNVISGNGGGVLLSLANGNRVQGNFIGTDITGTVAMGNRGNGIFIHAADNNTIGGTAPGAGNVISGHIGGGITLAQESTGNRVEGNFIGTDETGTLDLGNGGLGIHINDAPSNTIGGTVPGAGNIIAYNRDAGVAVGEATSTGNAILSNAIFANDPLGGPGLGIDLAPINLRDGVTPNDPGDGDTGGNNLQNFPVLTSALTTRGRLVVTGTIDTPNPETVTIEFFANPVPGDPTGHGEGAVFLGRASPTPQGQIFAVLPAVDLGTLISATATDADGNTSEFAENIPAESRRRGR